MNDDDRNRSESLSRRAAILGLCVIGASAVIGSTLLTSQEAEAHPHHRQPQAKAQETASAPALLQPRSSQPTLVAQALLLASLDISEL